MTRNRRYPQADRREVLLRVMRLVGAGNWITLDTETTGRELEDQVIEVAICDPLSLELPTRSWLIRPTIPIRGEATRLHGFRLEDLADSPTYKECWPEIEAAINGRKTVMYNAHFDFHRLFMSARAHQMKAPRIWTNLCAMEWYAIYHGKPFGYDGYEYQSLENACLQLEIPIEGPLHRAATDARLTASWQPLRIESDNLGKTRGGHCATEQAQTTDTTKPGTRVSKPLELPNGLPGGIHGEDIMSTFRHSQLFDTSDITTHYANALVVTGEKQTLQQLGQELATLTSESVHLEVSLYHYPAGPRLIILSLVYEHLVTMATALIRERIEQGFLIQIASEQLVPLERYLHQSDVGKYK